MKYLLLLALLSGIASAQNAGQYMFGKVGANRIDYQFLTLESNKYLKCLNGQLVLDIPSKSTVGLSNVENTALSTWVGTTAITTLGTIGTGIWSAANIGLANGGTGASLSDPNNDRIMFWDDSTGQVAWLTAGSGLTISGTTITATGGGGGGIGGTVGTISDRIPRSSGSGGSTLKASLVSINDAGDLSTPKILLGDDGAGYGQIALYDNFIEDFRYIIQGNNVVNFEGSVSLGGVLILPKTITPTGTTGARTIDQPSGSVNFAAAATSLVVTNSLVTSSSVVQVSKGTNDATARLGAVVVSSGSFTIFMDVAPTSETRVNFTVTQ